MYKSWEKTVERPMAVKNRIKGKSQKVRLKIILFSVIMRVTQHPKIIVVSAYIRIIFVNSKSSELKEVKTSGTKKKRFRKQILITKWQ
jgi:hypothetical protein